MKARDLIDVSIALDGAIIYGYDQELAWELLMLADGWVGNGSNDASVDYYGIAEDGTKCCVTLEDFS